MTASGGPGVFRITGVADFRDILRRFREVDDQAARTGARVGTSLGAGLDQIGTRTKAASDAAIASIEALNRRLTALRDRQINLSVNSREFQVVEARIAQLQSRISQLSGTQINIGADTRTLAGMQQRLQDIQAKLQQVDVNSRSFRTLSAEARKAEEALSRVQRSSSGIGDGIASSVGPLVAGFVSVAGAGALLKGSIDQAVQLETITRKLTNTLGAQGAGGALSFTRGLSDELGLSFNTLAGTFGSFTAAATSANVPLQVQQDLFAAVATSAQRLGLSNDELSGSLLALQQVASKGTVQMEELRGQLGERLPIAFGATARGLGVTQQQLIKLVESGRLTADQFFPALTKGLNELTADSGGVPTATQNFQALSNAWVELQANFGTSLLPTITAGVKQLTEALAGFSVQTEANKIGIGPQGFLNQLFGNVPAESAQIIGTLQDLEQRLGLTRQQSRAIFTNAAADVGATTNAFGQLNLSSEQYAEILERLPDLAKKFRDANPDRRGQELAAAAAAAKTAEALQKSLDIEKARVKAVVELNAVKAQEPVRALDAQIGVGQGVLSFAQAAASLEQARFETVRARTQFEIDNAQQLGLTQEQIAQRQKANDELKRQALIAQYQALLQAQQVETALLALSQRKAAVEAQIGVITAQQAAVRAQQAVAEARATGDATRIGQAIAAADLARVQVGLAQQRVALLKRTAPLEAAAAQAARETALQQLRTQGAALGVEQALVRITPAQQSLNAAYRKGVQTLTQFPGELNTISGAIGDTSQQAQTIVRAFTDASGAITVLSQTADAAGQRAGKLGEEVGKAKDSAEGFEAADLGAATGEAADKSRTFASNMADAASSAADLLRYLSSAAGLAPARFTGGPVEGGARYRVNDGPGGVSLGREAFLSAAGRLSLINAPANSLWTAPTSGTVIPAAMTRQLTDAGLVGPHASVVASHHAVAMQGRSQRTTASPARAPISRGVDPTMARLELAVTNLAGQVKALTQKQWTVPVNVRNSAGTTQLRVLNGLV